MYPTDSDYLGLLEKQFKTMLVDREAWLLVFNPGLLFAKAARSTAFSRIKITAQMLLLINNLNLLPIRNCIFRIISGFGLGSHWRTIIADSRALDD